MLRSNSIFNTLYTRGVIPLQTLRSQSDMHHMSMERNNVMLNVYNNHMIWEISY